MGFLRPDISSDSLRLTDAAHESGRTSSLVDHAGDQSFDALLRAAAQISEGGGTGEARLALGGTLAGGRLQILRRLGSGGMGVVFEAFDAERRTTVALKVLTDVRPDRVYRVKNEFRALLEVRNESLLRLYELFSDEGLWYYTMELVRGVPFDLYVRGDEARLRSCLSQLGSAVWAMHDAGKLHRDLKPSNVLVTDEGRLVVLDFGLSIDAAAGGIGQTLSERQAVCGTPAYMAPEQAAGEPPLPASDLYAVGVMLFEALTGRLPFEGHGGAVAAAKQRDEAPALPDELALPDDLRRLCHSLLARLPGERPTAAELALQLGVEVSAPSSHGLGSGTMSRLFGRELELAQLEQAFADTLRGEAVVVRVTGESGLGKSALCASFVARLRARGAMVLDGRCYERESVPFKAFDPLIDGLTRVLRRLASDELARLLPDDLAALVRLFPVLERIPAFAQAGPLDVSASQALQQRAFSALGNLLAQLCTRGPLVLVMDDLQWADADSLLLLSALLTRAVRVPMLLIASHRPDAAARPLDRVFALACENHSLRVLTLPLAPLVPEATAALVSAFAPSVTSSAATLVDIVRSCEGNPFFARTLARFAEEHGSAKTSLHAALGARIAAVSAGAQRLLSLLALAGGPLLARVALAVAEATHEDLEQLRREHLSRVGISPHVHGSGKTVECYHDRIGESVLATLDPDRRAAQSRRLFEALANLDDASAELQRRCLLYAGDHEGALRLAVRAAERAVSALAFDRAAELYTEALASPRVAASERLVLTAKCAEALIGAGRAAEAGRLFRAAAAMTTGAVSLSNLQHAANHLLFAGNYAEGRDLLEQVCKEIGVFFPRRSMLSAAHFAWTESGLRLRGLGCALRPDRPGIDKTRLEAASTLATSLLNYAPVHAPSACSNYLRLSLGQQSATHVPLALGLNALLHCRIPRSHRWTNTLVARLWELAEVSAEPWPLAFATYVRGQVAHFQRRLEEADEHLRGALALSRGAGNAHQMVDVCQLILQNNSYMRGDLASIVRETPSAIDSAFRRGRVWVGVMMSGAPGLPAWLVHDDADAARARIADARARWIRPPRPQLPDFMVGVAEAALTTYTGHPERGLELLCIVRRELTAALDGPMFQPMMAIPEGKCAASALRARGRTQAGRAELQRTVATSLETLRRGGRAWDREALLLDAALQLDSGDVEGAARLLLHDEALLRQGGVQGAARSLRAGQLLGGSRGASLVAEARQTMSAHGVVDADAMAEFLTPGLRA